ncbi:MAG TPA: PEP-CTERM sorting domain-containing protein [Acidobacteriaceae bacterium]|nr:PEP-CTERM sorting domain-containing protein [Acidobacteriaceae bacterium]
MKLKLRVPAMCLLAFGCVFATVPASASYLVYDNTGPGSYSTNAWSIFDVGGGASVVTNSFTLSSTTNLQGANFYAWVLPGDSLTSVSWSITDTAYGTSIASGTVAGGPNTQVATAFGYYPVLEESLSIPALNLAAGTYWFQLSEGLDAYDNNVYWDESDGPSTAFESGGVGQIPSETFQLIATPEPSSFTLLGLGMLTLAGVVTRSKLLA